MKYQAVLFDWAGTLGTSKLEIKGNWTQQLISELYEAGYRLGIISNNNRYADTFWLRKRLTDLDWSKYFEVVVGSGSCQVLHDNSNCCSLGLSKPDPQIFKRAADFMGVPLNKCLYVGDDYEADLVGATNAGMEAVLVSVEQDYSQILWAILKDQPVKRPNILTQYVTRFLEGGSISITTRLRHLNEPVEIGSEIVVNGENFIVNAVIPSHTKDDILEHSRTVVHIKAHGGHWIE